MMNNKSHQQLNMINDRLEKLVDKMNKDYNACVQELLQCDCKTNSNEEI